MEFGNFNKMKNNLRCNRGAMAVEFAIAMIIMAAIFSYAVPLVKDMSVEALDEQAETVSKHYP